MRPIGDVLRIRQFIVIRLELICNRGVDVNVVLNLVDWRRMGGNAEPTNVTLRYVTLSGQSRAVLLDLLFAVVQVFEPCSFNDTSRSEHVRISTAWC